MEGVFQNIGSTPDITDSCSPRIGIYIQRYEYANLFHTMTDWYNVFQVIQIYGLENTNSYDIIWLDGHSWGHLEP
eukprot:UN05307